ncbi:MAG: hypothetical protein QXR62_05020 [Candidatus Bathyarchaeia archaeon]
MVDELAELYYKILVGKIGPPSTKGGFKVPEMESFFILSEDDEDLEEREVFDGREWAQRLLKLVRENRLRVSKESDYTEDMEDLSDEDEGEEG